MSLTLREIDAKQAKMELEASKVFLGQLESITETFKSQIEIRLLKSLLRKNIGPNAKQIIKEEIEIRKIKKP